MSEADATTVVLPALKHYAIWYGPVYNEIYDCHVDSRDPTAYVMDQRADYFRFYDRLELEWEIDGEVIRLRSEPFNHSAFYVPGGRLLTREEKDGAFAGRLSAFGGDRDKYVVFSTRYREVDLIFNDRVEFPPGPK